MIMGRVRVKAKVQMTQTKHEPSKWGLWGSNVRLPALNLTLTLLTLTLTLPTLTLALFSQTLLYWSDCLMVALRHWDNSFYHCYPPHFNTLPSLYINVFLTIGACWIRTHVKPISLIYRAGTSKFERDPPGVQNTGRTTCLQQIKEPI